jgi:hypothetical protein
LLSEKLNHHFVPQFHLRLFTGGKKYIHLASRDGSRLALFASIKGQCARHRYYGNLGMEEWLGKREHEYAEIFRRILGIAWNGCTALLSKEEENTLREALVIQRVRTPRHVDNICSGIDQVILSTYLEHLKESPETPERQAKMKAIESGRAEVKDSKSISLMQMLFMAPRTSTIISDLALVILRNLTDKPFLLGDTPCVFCNYYLRHIRGMGVLGLLSPGLMVVLPIDTRTQILLYDSATYRCAVKSVCFDVRRPFDVYLLNAQQIHAAEEYVYFVDEAAEAYVRNFISAQRKYARDSGSKVITHKPGTMLVGNFPSEHEIIHSYQAKLPIELDLSFISTERMPKNETPNRPRNQELARQFMEQRESRDNMPIGIDKFGDWIEFNL